MLKLLTIILYLLIMFGSVLIANKLVGFPLEFGFLAIIVALISGYIFSRGKK